MTINKKFSPINKKFSPVNKNFSSVTTVINLFGAPGSGKSVNASKIYAALKETGLDAELVTEYVKQWAWEGREHTSLDQFYFFCKTG